MKRRFPAYGLCALSFVWTASLCMSGRLTPTEPPAPTMKSLDELVPAVALSQDDFPLNIILPGVYYLTENIHLSQNDGHAVTINCDNVTLDLKGYTLSGSDAESVNGITSWNHENIEIRNGTVRDFAHGISESWTGSKFRILNVRSISNLSHGFYLNGSGHTLRNCWAEDNGGIGIYCGNTGSVRDCQSIRNGTIGIRVYNDCLVRNCTVVDSGGRGIQLGSNSNVRDCVINGNGYRGIDAADNCRITGNTCKDNTDVGIYAAEGCVVSANMVSSSSVHGIAVTYGCTVTGNTAFNNGSVGIHGGNGATVTDNTAYGNQASGISGILGCLISRNTVRDNTGDGIYAVNDCTVTLNNCYNNGKDEGSGAGIKVRYNCRVESNHVTANDWGIRTQQDSNLIVKNSVRANTTAFDITGGNKVGPITADPTTAGPWANFSY